MQIDNNIGFCTLKDGHSKNLRICLPHSDSIPFNFIASVVYSEGVARPRGVDGTTSTTITMSAQNNAETTHDIVKRDVSKENTAQRDDSRNDQTVSQQPDTTAANQDVHEVYSVFTPRIKAFVICMTVFSTVFSPLSSFIYLPAITPIANHYHRSIADINLTVTLYQVMQALAPLFFGDLSDQIGRRPVYLITFAIYIAANIGLALQDNYVALMVLRALQSTGSSATVAIGSAVVGDLTTSAERGGYIAAVQASIQFAPALAPVLGGILAQYLGWRSTFWFLVIGAGVFLIVYLPLVPEVSSMIGPPMSVADALLDCKECSWQWFYRTAAHQSISSCIPPAAEEADRERGYRGELRNTDCNTTKKAQEDPHSQHLGSHPHRLRKGCRTFDAVHVSLRHGELCYARPTSGCRSSRIWLQRPRSRSVLHSLLSWSGHRIDHRWEAAQLAV